MKLPRILSVITSVSLLIAAIPNAVAAPEAPPLPPDNNFSSAVSGENIRVLVTLKDQPRLPGEFGSDTSYVQKQANAFASKYGFQVDRKFSYLVNAISGSIAAQEISHLKLDPAVAAVEKLRIYYPLMESASTLSGSQKARKDFGVDGAGTVISIIDTGVDIHHQDMRLDPDVAPRIAPSEGFTPKVPYGYNFADENNIVKDTTASQHGMHVAGIAAANGGKEANVAKNSRMNGIAPNAQILAMKVFSNDPNKKGAGADDVMAAIEESVKRGADVINLSLGYPNGHEAQNIGEQRAIENARAAGVEVIVAAGNEGQNGSPTGENNDALGMLDDGTVASPSTGVGAWSVASIENQLIVNSLGIARNTKATHKFGFDLQTGTADGQEHELVDAGVGSFNDTFGKDFSGKYVLIQRGGMQGENPITFKDKFTNAQIAKAAGVIIYNHAKGGDDLPGMGGIESFKIPGIAIGHSDGVKLKELISQGLTKIKLTDAHISRTNPNAMRPSAFSSWGSAPELGFKPEISGIGGNVYSTVNDHKYATKSGTSMAAPYVAGVSALMIEKNTQKFPKLKRKELVARNRIALSNTASILKHDDIPFAPRQIGAGLVQTDAALRTSVLATVDDSPVLALREVKGTRDFTVTLENEADHEFTFTPGATCVVNENNSLTETANTHCSTSDTIAAEVSEIKVPAKGTAKVKYTLKVSGADHWTQGWVTFKSKDPQQPDLALPYLGFAGDWNAERIIDTPRYAGFDQPILDRLEKNPTITSLYTQINQGEYTFRDGEQFISPNGDGLADVIYAKVAMLRNAKEVKITVVDEDKKLVRAIGKQDDVVRPTIKAQLAEMTNAMQTDFSSIVFDGKKYDQRKASFENVADGKYFFRIEARMGAEYEPQILDLPFAIDRVAPKVEVLSIQKNAAGNYEVKVSATDNASGVNAVQGRFTWPSSIITKDETMKDKTPADGVHTLIVNGPIAEKVGYFEIYASDLATNVVRKTVMVSDRALIVESADTLAQIGTINASAQSEQTDEILVQNGKLVLTGRAGEKVRRVRAGDALTDVPESGRFEIRPSVIEGENTVVVAGLDTAGNVVAKQSFTFTYDGTAPQFSLSEPAGWPKVLARSVNGKVKIKGKVTDNLSPVSNVMIDGESFPVAEDGSFSAEISVADGSPAIMLSAFDKAWNKAEAIVRLENPDPQAAPLQLLANLGFAQAFNVVSGENDALQQKSEDVAANGLYTFMYKGKFNRMPQKFIVAGNDVSVAPDGSFETEISLREGITDVNVQIIDVDGAEIANTQMKVLLDLHAPNVEFTKPQIDADGALYLHHAGDVEFSGSVADNAFGYQLTINGNAVERFLSYEDPDRDAGKRDFTHLVTAEDGDKLLVVLKDHFDNTYLRMIPVVVDNIAPEVTVSGLADGDVRYFDPEANGNADLNQNAGAAVSAKVQVKDANLQHIALYVDGKLVTTKQVALVPAAGAVTKISEGFGKRKPPANGDNRGDQARAAADSDADNAAGSDLSRAAHDATEKPQQELSFTLTQNFAPGEHRIFVEARDKAGNTQVQQLSFTVKQLSVPEKEQKPGAGSGEVIVPGIDQQDLVPLPESKPQGWDTWIPSVIVPSAEAGRISERGQSRQQDLASAMAERAKMIAATGANTALVLFLATLLVVTSITVRRIQTRIEK